MHKRKCLFSLFTKTILWLSCPSCIILLKPMDSFGTWRKWKSIFFAVNAEFYRVVWTINALLTVLSEMLPFSGNNQNIKMFGVPPNTLPYIVGYVYNGKLTLGNIALIMSFKTIVGRSHGVSWWFPALSEDQEKICWIHQNYLVALKWMN